MKRRDVIKRTAFLSGAALATPLYSALLSGCSPSGPPETGFTPAIFRQGQYSLLEQIANTLLPATDTPSATEVGVVQVIDQIVAEVYSPEQTKDYFTAFGLVENALDASFSSASLSEKTAALQKLEESGGALKDAWVHIKQQLISMYLSSEEIAENYLNYLPVPGDYEPCIKLSDTNGKAWAI